MSKYEIAITRIDGLPDDTGDEEQRAIRHEMFRQTVDNLVDLGRLWRRAAIGKKET